MTQLAIIDAKFLHDHKLPDGHGFPLSYIDFVTRLGWGRLCNLFLVYVPLRQHPDSWSVQSPKIKQYMNEFYDEMEHDPFLLEPDGYAGLEDALVPFALSENGEYLAWDSANRKPSGEMPIYVLAARLGGIRYGGESLNEFVENCTSEPAVKNVLGPRYQKLPLSFEPLDVAPLKLGSDE